MCDQGSTSYVIYLAVFVRLYVYQIPRFHSIGYDVICEIERMIERLKLRIHPLNLHESSFDGVRHIVH